MTSTAGRSIFCGLCPISIDFLLLYIAKQSILVIRNIYGYPKLANLTLVLTRLGYPFSNGGTISVAECVP